jgi:hypothetical protein
VYGVKLGSLGLIGKIGETSVSFLKSLLNFRQSLSETGVIPFDKGVLDAG